jgi:nucleotide-binding universal stress UspA family protein
MQQNGSATSIVVGIDGSLSAVHAARWAIEEAVSREIPLRLIHVVQSTSADEHREVEEGEPALREARSAITQTGRNVKVETDVVRGPVAATLVAEASEAVMICLGSAGSELQAAKFIGATATAVALAAPAEVAIVRFRADASEPAGDVAVLIDDPMDLEVVMREGLREARLRHAALLVLNLTATRLREFFPEDVDRRLAELVGRDSDVRPEVFMAPDDVATFLEKYERPVQLVVLGNARGSATQSVVGPYGRFVLRDTECSVLVARRHG